MAHSSYARLLHIVIDKNTSVGDKRRPLILDTVRTVKEDKMGKLVMLILLALKIGQNGLGECSASEKNRRFIVDESCDTFQEYQDLRNLQSSQTCTSANEVWAILERLYRYGEFGESCMNFIINQLGQIFHGWHATPSYCSCTGRNELDYYYVRDDLPEYINQCWQGPYIQIFSDYFYNENSPSNQVPPWCDSHHSEWSLLAGISSYNCRLDIVRHIADKFRRLPNYCSCHHINTGSGLQQGTFAVTAGPVTVPSDHCLQYDSYMYLHYLALNPSMCVSVNNMWSYLADIHSKSEECRRKILDNMGNIFKDYQQFSQHCVCTGQDIHRTPVRIPNLDQNYCRDHHTHYLHFHEEMYELGPSPCRSHQYMWNYFNEISYDTYRDCKVDFILHAAATYPNAKEDPCLCFSDSQSSQKSTISTIMPTTLSQTTVITMTTTTAATMTTTNHILAANTTPDVLYDVHICNKASTIADAAHNLTIKHPNATDCTSGDHASTEALVLSNCNVGSATMWVKGENVMDICSRIPLYSPIATFDASGVYRPNGGMAGIFLGCIQDGFKIAAQNCNHGVSIQHITKGGIFLNDPSNYYIIRG